MKLLKKWEWSSLITNNWLVNQAGTVQCYNDGRMKKKKKRKIRFRGKGRKGKTGSGSWFQADVRLKKKRKRKREGWEKPGAVRNVECKSVDYSLSFENLQWLPFLFLFFSSSPVFLLSSPFLARLPFCSVFLPLVESSRDDAGLVEIVPLPARFIPLEIQRGNALREPIGWAVPGFSLKKSDDDVVSICWLLPFIFIKRDKRLAGCRGFAPLLDTFN